MSQGMRWGRTAAGERGRPPPAHADAAQEGGEKRYASATWGRPWGGGVEREEEGEGEEEGGRTGHRRQRAVRRRPEGAVAAVGSGGGAGAPRRPRQEDDAGRFLPNSGILVVC